ALWRFPRQSPALPCSLAGATGHFVCDDTGLLARRARDAPTECPQSASSWVGRGSLYDRVLAEDCHWDPGAIRLHLVSCVDPGNFSRAAGSIRPVSCPSVRSPICNRSQGGQLMTKALPYLWYPAMFLVAI